MKKPTSGRAAFVAMGRSAHSRGLPLSYQRQMRVNWPRWMREAWAAGWLMQVPRNPVFKGK